MKNYKLVNFLSHKMSNQDFEKGMQNLYMTLEAQDYRGYGTKSIINWFNSDDKQYCKRIYRIMYAFRFYSLNHCTWQYDSNYSKFKSKYGIEKLSFITLTDGVFRWWRRH